MFLTDLLASHRERNPRVSRMKFLPKLFETIGLGLREKNKIVGLGPSELFVHRNIADLAPPVDANVQSLLQYAVETLKIKHIIVCGETGRLSSWLDL